MLIVSDILACASSAAPNHVAVTLGDDFLTFSETQQRCNRLANALSEWGLGHGDRVAYWADIDIDAVPLQFALGRLGAVYAPLNPAYSEDETREALKYLRPRLLIADPAHAAVGSELAAAVGVPVIVTGTGGDDATLDALAASAGDDEPTAPLPSDEDPFTIFLTSGSTGRPKGVVISHRATWLRAHGGSVATVTTGSSKGQLVMFPLYHMAGWTFAYYAWSLHEPAHLVRRADSQDLLAAVARHRPGTLYCIPAVWQRILDDPGHYDTSSLDWALVGTSLVEPALLQALKERFPQARVTVNYGSTEICRALSLGDADLLRKPGSVGLPAAGVRAMIADDGELLLRAPTLMSGYFERPDETAQALHDGWYHTGDLVVQDEEGYFSVVGRKRDIIRSGGEWIAPSEVESALSDYPGVADLAVVGLPDAEWGELVCLNVVMAGGAAPPSVAEVRQHLSGRLAPYKHPRRVVVVEELPRTSVTGQVQRARLVEEARVG